MKVLILDDDPATLAALADLLRLEGHDVVAVGTVITGINSMAVDGPPDIAFVDVYLAASTGAAFMKAVKNKPSFRSVPVILMSGAGEDDPVVKEAIALGAAGYLKKPFDPKELFKAIDAVAGSKSR